MITKTEPKQDKKAGLSGCDFDIDTLLDNEDCFRPLTSGLGFHKREIEPHDSIFLNKKKITKKTNSVESSGFKIGRETKMTYEEAHKHSVSEFYLEKKMDINEMTKTSLFEEASLFRRFLAFMIDILSIILFFITTLGLFSYVGGVDYEYYAKLRLDIIFGIMALILFLIYYFTYFIFLDMTDEGTLGKSFLGLKPLSYDNKTLKMGQSFLRSLFVLLSPITFFVLVLMDFHGMLTHSKIVRKS